MPTFRFVRPLALAWALPAALPALAQSTPPAVEPIPSVGVPAPAPVPVDVRGAVPAAGEARPLWEAGVAVLGSYGPDYPSAASRRARGIAAPVIIYRGTWLRADDDGVRSVLLKQGNLQLDVSAAASFNARSNDARSGMPDLDYLFQLGPQAVYRVALDGGQAASAHLKVRGVASTDFKRVDGRGWVVEQEFRWVKRGWPEAASQVMGGAQFFWASEKLHDYFYQVDPSQATATRSAYDAKAGYFGSALRLGYSRRLSATLSATAGVTLNLHGGAANRDSPLFQNATTTNVLVAVVWMPWKSDTLVAP